MTGTLAPERPSEPLPDGGRRRFARPAVVVAAVVLGGLVWVLATTSKDDGPSPLAGKPAPAIEGRGISGGGFSLAGARGSYVVVNFFATWCGPCRTEHPELVKFAERHKAEGDARVVSVAFQDDDKKLAAFFRERGGDWPVIADHDGRVALDYGVTGIPESYLIDPGGIVISKITGGVTADALDALVEEAER